MPLDFYYSPLSGFCRSIILTAKIVDIELNLKKLDLRKGDQMDPDFLIVLGFLILSIPSRRWWMTVFLSGKVTPSLYTWWRNTVRATHCIQKTYRRKRSLTKSCSLT